MSDLLNYCLEQLAAGPRALNIRVPLDTNARRNFSRAWAHSRFEIQQQSILARIPDDPLFGRGYLWPYELVWRETSEGHLLRIEYNLNTEASPRELILLASVSETAVPFPHSRAVFHATKSRMLGRERKRPGGTMVQSLRPGVAAVQYSRQNNQSVLTAVHYPDFVDVEF